LSCMATMIFRNDWSLRMVHKLRLQSLTGFCVQNSKKNEIFAYLQ
jgi:hypothetical protein